MEGASDGTQPSAKRHCPVKEQQCRADPQQLREAILHSLGEPVVFRGYLGPAGGEGGEGKGGWPCLQWDVDEWTQVFGGLELHFRVGPRVAPGKALVAPQWEGECLKAVMTLQHFLTWARGTGSCTTTCGREVTCHTHWAYFDYYYMRSLPGVCSARGGIDWGALGFPGRGAEETTLWLGSAGANTPCHRDTYGCNLVAQVRGRKRWVLFPPCQSDLLGATRVPYEESSVYSGAGFPRPSLHHHPDLATSTPHLVTLQPGDVLLVPRHWWHSVENLDLALSVNTWLEVPQDGAERVREALVMYQVASLCQGVTCLDLLKQVLNPNMLEVTTMTSSALLDLLRAKVLTHCHPEPGPDLSTKHSARHSTEWLQQHSIHRVPSITFDQYQHCILEAAGQQGGALQPGRREDGHCDPTSDHGKDLTSDPSKDLTSDPSKDLTSDPSKELSSDPDKDLNSDHNSDTSEELNNNPSSDLSSDLRLLLDAFTDSRIIDALKQVLDEKLQARRRQPRGR